jgi:single-strand DNA-binding protein
MAGEIAVTLVGNLAADPELRFIPSGAAVANFTVAQTPRTFDRQSNEWKDGETVWMRCAVWRDTAENVAASLHKGDRVVVTGRLKSRQYEKDGQNHTVIECEVDEIGAALRYAEVRVSKTERTQAPQQQQADPWATQGQQPQRQADPWAGQPAPQPPQQGWGAPPPQQQQPQPAQAPQQGGWGAPPQYDQPPF